jgi:hypothetical protein
MPKANQDYNLYLLKPNLVKEWHPTKNIDLKPRDVTPGSGKKAWWLCSNGHEWEAAIYSRSRGSGCPYCSKPRSTDDSNLPVSNSSLTLEWHPSANGSLTPRRVTLAYPKKVWWICNQGHEWEATVKCRLSGKGCPICEKDQVKVISHKFKTKSRQKKIDKNDITPSRRSNIIFESDSSDISAGKNYRKSKRIKSKGIAILEIPFSGHWLYAQIRNFSHAGMYVETEVAIRPGTKINVKLDQPLFYSDQKSYNSIIQWCKELHSNNPSFSNYGLGVRFI